MGEIARLVPVLPVSLIATVLLEAERAARRARAQGARLRPDGAFRGRGAKLYLPRGDRDYAFHVGLRMLALRHLVERAGEGLFAAVGNRAAPARVLRQRHRPSALTMPPFIAAGTLWSIAYSVGPGLLHQPPLDLGRGDGVLHDVRDRPDHDLQHRHGRTVRRAADGAGGDVRALGTVSQPDQLQGIRRFASQELFRGGGLAAVIGALVLLYTGSRVFVELDDGINAIWSTPAIQVLQPCAPSIRCWRACSHDCSRWP